MKNWKTTVFALMAAVLPVAKMAFPQYSVPIDLATSLALALFGYHAADKSPGTFTTGQ